MTRRLAIPFLMVAGAVLAAGVDVHDFTIRTEVRLVLLDVSVRNHRGELVSGLTQNNFRVLEDGHPQKITTFANHDLPVTIGILVDESASMTPKRQDVLTAAVTFIKESNPGDEVFVLNFNDTVRRGLPNSTMFSSSVPQLRSALNRGVPTGKTALNDAVVEGLGQLKLGKRDKKALILISDGGDNASKATRKEALELVERNIATIYTIGLFDEDNLDKDPALLKRLAKISGGDAFLPRSSAGMVEICRRIAKDIRARYTIGYFPQNSNGKAQRHIRVEASADGMGKLTAQTRTSYRFEGDQSGQDKGQER